MHYSTPFLLFTLANALDIVPLAPYGEQCCPEDLANCQYRPLANAPPDIAWGCLLTNETPTCVDQTKLCDEACTESPGREGGVVYAYQVHAAKIDCTFCNQPDETHQPCVCSNEDASQASEDQTQCPHIFKRQ